MGVTNARNGPVDLPDPGRPGGGAPAAKALGPLARLAPEPMKVVLNWGRRYSLWVFNFGLACCAIEFIAASMARHDFIRLGVIPFAPGPRQADLMVVSGTVTDKMAPAVKRLYEQMPEPKYVISFGACSNCGGPYWDSYAVTKGVDQIIPVDVYVPGCPPRPEALLQGVLKLQEKIAAESTAQRYATGRGRPSAAALRSGLVKPPEGAGAAGAEGTSGAADASGTNGATDANGTSGATGASGSGSGGAGPNGGAADGSPGAEPEGGGDR
ncbi:NADH-quinone oxidoreductase B subunit [Streptomyces sp. Amel2xB2]|uniref:NADH-quinone oxidoreductase subunit B n=1 Tax=Streptomyces sp. Amel2xB2 TaxID=1305829 RepID=UPI000DB90EE3|nr:NADH-quinone oxidoreductase subunit B [Streptomyces sp. Amel2xB2]RAJ71927.1 NADH-quinone oxidoreductase B subunit [Streptomyces sp. Amel2xB2]